MSEPENATAAAQRGPRVLVIEDDEVVARAVVRGIERAAMPAAWASTGALGMALKDSFRPQIVLVDLTRRRCMDQQLSLEKPVGNFNKITFGVGEA